MFGFILMRIFLFLAALALIVALFLDSQGVPIPW